MPRRCLQDQRLRRAEARPSEIRRASPPFYGREECPPISFHVCRWEGPCYSSYRKLPCPFLGLEVGGQGNLWLGQTRERSTPQTRIRLGVLACFSFSQVRSLPQPAAIWSMKRSQGGCDVRLVFPEVGQPFPAQDVPLAEANRKEECLGRH